MKPESYPLPTSSVELVQTHVSWIFLTDSHAFKIKKPVNFGFLDFSTLELRHFYCNEELRLNRRLCPEIYEDVIPLRESGKGAAFSGDGPIVDYAVMMKRLPAERMLDKLVESGAATPEELKNVAAAVSRFHAAAETSAHISGFGSLQQIMFNWNENLEQMLPYQDSTLPAEERYAIQEWVTEFSETHRDLFERRVKGGYIRDCDGDLHLENICLTGERVCIFDCIEFNERFRFCDTAADIAFLLMDLDFHGRRDLAQTVFTTYQEASGDPELAPLTDFYKVYRAFVRGKVESFRTSDRGISRESRALAGRRAIRYFRLARGYCQSSRLRPTLFITCGSMGCGKSTLADQLAFELGISLHNSDVVRKKLAGKPLLSAVSDHYGQGLYDSAMTERTYAELMRLAENELAAGRSTVIDASFNKAARRGAFAELAARRTCGFIILKVLCDRAEQKKRLIKRSESGTSVSDGRLELLERQMADFEAPSPHEGRIIQLNTINTPETLASHIYRELERQ